MGWWKTERGIGGDEWADRFAEFRDSLQAIKRGEREITMQEFADLIEFCTRGHIVADVRFPETDGERPLSQLHDKGVETYTNRGQIHCADECAVGRQSAGEGAP